MSPSRTSLTLGVLGTGTVSEKAAIALLDDLLEANGGRARVIIPATEEHWSAGIETVADWAISNKYPLEVVVDDSSAKAKALKGYIQKAQKTHKATKVLTKVANLSEGGKLIVLWDDENETVYDALEAAEAKGIPALDITQGLEAIEMSDEQAEEDVPEEDAPEPEEEAAADNMDILTDAEIELLADEWGVNPEDFDTWAEVREAIRVAQAGGDEDEIAAGAEEDAWPTPDDVEGWEFDDLKSFATENQIEVPPRSRTLGYKKAILEFLATVEDNTAALEQEESDLGMADDLAEGDDEADLDLPQDDEEPVFENDDEPVVTNLDGEALKSIVAEALKPTLDNVGQLIGRLGMSIDKLTAEVGESFSTLNAALDHIEKSLDTQPEPPRKAAAPTKAAPRPTKAPAAPRKAPAPAKKATAAPAKIDPPKTKGEQIMGPVLKHAEDTEVTKATATKILELWDQRPKGRPTERERNLYNLARKVIPEVKRPPGRPRKA